MKNTSFKFIKLSKNTFFRKYNNIGYLYNQFTNMDVVLDEIGSVFMSEITRMPKSIQSIVKSISIHFVDAEINEIERDFFDFINSFSDDNFFITSNSLEIIDPAEMSFYSKCNNIVIPVNDYYEPSSEYLKKYFWNSPHLFSAQIELTSLCNLNCVHCYLGDNHLAGGMSTKKIIDLLDELKVMGTLKVTFSGGEAFLHPNLPEILTHARNNDFSIAILTNGTQISDSLIDSIKVNNVGIIQISLYSLNSDIHDFITQHQGSHARTMSSIHRLIEAEIPIQIACPVMKPNLNTLGDLIEWGVKNRIRVNPDVIITARSNFESDNLKYRLDISDVGKAIKIITERDSSYQNLLLTKKLNQKELNYDDPVCGIGSSSLCISSDGFFYPCPGMQLKIGDFNLNSLSDIWNNSHQIKELRKIKKISYSNCVRCSSIDYCMICPAKFYNESNGDYLKTSQHFCSVAKINQTIAEDYIHRNTIKSATQTTD